MRTQGYGNAEKLTDLLGRLGLEDRAAASPAVFSRLLDAAPDWDTVRERVVEGRAAACEYLAKEVSACTRS